VQLDGRFGSATIVAVAVVLVRGHLIFLKPNDGHSTTLKRRR
jgi:hypothetical protein